MSFITSGASNGAFVTSNGVFVISNSIFDAKFDFSSRYADRHEVAQRSFFGPSGGKSDAVRSFLMVPRPTFDIPWPPSVGFCSHFDSVGPRIKKCELSNDCASICAYELTHTSICMPLFLFVVFVWSPF